jgi:hypothetical protein
MRLAGPELVCRAAEKSDYELERMWKKSGRAVIYRYRGSCHSESLTKVKTGQFVIRSPIFEYFLMLKYKK